ncbi:hypothetical protein CLU96_1448 [Chryseobacterium sp. 52]|nr:hypothetical protein CLU96_1448 [Chryseobacterium sp. 52]
MKPKIIVSNELLLIDQYNLEKVDNTFGKILKEFKYNYKQ